MAEDDLSVGGENNGVFGSKENIDVPGEFFSLVIPSLYCDVHDASSVAEDESPASKDQRDIDNSGSLMSLTGSKSSHAQDVGVRRSSRQGSKESTGQPDDGRRPGSRSSKKLQAMTDEDQVRRSSRQGSKESTGQPDDGRRPERICGKDLWVTRRHKVQQQDHRQPDCVDDPRSKMLPVRRSIRDSTLLAAMFMDREKYAGLSRPIAGDDDDDVVYERVLGMDWSRPIAGDDDDVVYERIVDVLGREPVPNDKVLPSVLYRQAIITFEDLSKLGFFDYRHVFPIQMEVHVAAR